MNGLADSLTLSLCGLPFFLGPLDLGEDFLVETVFSSEEVDLRVFCCCFVKIQLEKERRGLLDGPFSRAKTRSQDPPPPGAPAKKP